MNQLLSHGPQEFAPRLLAIQDSPPARLPRMVLYSVGALFALQLLWAIFGQLDIVASADGRLIPQSYVKIVQPADAGIVQEILVTEGQSVQAGQVLMRMDPRIAQADEQTVRSEMALRSLQLRRIDAELTGAPLARRADDPQELFGHVQAQYRDHRAAMQDALGQQRQALTRAEQDHQSATESLTKLRRITPILEQQASSMSELGRDGYVAQMAAQDKQRDYVEKAQDLRAQEANVGSARAAIEQARQQLNQVASKYRSDLQNERIEAQAAFNKLQQDLAKQSHKSELLELKASQAGIVKDLATHTIGAVVSPGTVLLSIVPEHEPLVAEVMVKNDDVGFVYPQQQVKVKLAAYPFQKYGMLEGRVRRIGPDAIEPQNTNSNKDAADKDTTTRPSLNYRAIVELQAQELRTTSGEELKLVPGMQVIAEINQGQRSVMDYLLSPVSKALRESGRER